MKLSAVLALGALSSVLASDVIDLSESNFHEFLEDNDLVMAEFFAPWCGHCKALAPEYESAAETLKEKGIPLGKIDCTESSSLCSELEIQGYPTLKVFRGADSVRQYNGARTADGIVSYMIKQALPAVSNVGKDNLEEFSKSDSVVIVGFFDDKKSNSTFHKLAEELREKYVFGSSGNADLAEKYGITSFPALVVFKDFDDGVAVYDSSSDGFKFSSDALTNFVKTEAFPLVGSVGPGTYNDYASSGIPLAYLFVDNTEDEEELVQIVKPYAKKLKGKLNFGVLDAKLYGGHAANVNLRADKWPAFVIQNFETGAKYIHDQDQDITEASLTDLLDKFEAGTLQPHVKSQPIPETQDDSVIVVVGKSYNDVVLDDDKDVLIEFYAPWCGHCKNLAPIYEELAGLYANNSELKDKVVIAKLDHTENEVPDEIAGYPTIKLYPAGDKENPIVYKEARTLEALAKFVKTYGTHKADALNTKPKKAAKKAGTKSGTKAKKAAKEKAESVERDEL